MGEYINPVGTTEANGRRLNTKDSYPEMAEQLVPGENLIGIYKRWFGQCEAILNESEFIHFRDEENNRDLIGYYALPAAVEPSAPDLDSLIF